jgi:hypothetical protein
MAGEYDDCEVPFGNTLAVFAYFRDPVGMPAKSQWEPLVDEASLVFTFSADARAAWDDFSPGGRATLAGWCLKPRWQRSRRERAAQLDRRLALGATATGPSPDNLLEDGVIALVLGGWR